MKKLLPILIAMGVLWCIAGAFVLGPGILLYPAAWGVLALMMLALHKTLHRSKDRAEPQMDPQREEVPHDSRMIPS